MKIFPTKSYLTKIAQWSNADEFTPSLKASPKYDKGYQDGFNGSPCNYKDPEYEDGYKEGQRSKEQSGQVGDVHRRERGVSVPVHLAQAGYPVDFDNYARIVRRMTDEQIEGALRDIYDTLPRADELDRGNFSGGNHGAKYRDQASVLNQEMEKRKKRGRWTGSDLPVSMGSNSKNIFKLSQYGRRYPTKFQDYIYDEISGDEIPVNVYFRYYGPDRDVGIFSESAQIERVVTLDGKDITESVDEDKFERLEIEAIDVVHGKEDYDADQQYNLNREENL